MPTSAAMTFSRLRLEPVVFPDLARLDAIKLPANVNYARGTVLGEITASPGTFKAYNDANNDGTQVARCILAYDVATDANGNITLTSTNGQVGGEWGQQEKSVGAWFKGVFKTADLTGLDAAAVTDLGRLHRGTVADGFLSIG